MSATRVLVTGATGVVGRLVMPQLLARGHRVTAVARTAEKRARLAALGAEAVALDVPAGAYNVCDDEPLTRREWADALAYAAGAPRPRLLPRWLTAVGGATAELLSRSQRMSNASLRRAAGWTPRWRSAREGLRAAVESLFQHQPEGVSSWTSREQSS